MDPRRELVAMQIAATQAINAENNPTLPPTAISTSSLDPSVNAADFSQLDGISDGNDGVISNEIEKNINDTNNDSHGNDSKNIPHNKNISNVVCVEEIFTIATNSPIPLGIPPGTSTVSPVVGTLDPHSVPTPIAATIITPQGIFIATHNPRMQNRINLMAPHTTAHTHSDENENTNSECPTISDTVSAYVPVRAVTAEGVRVLSCVGVLESWRSKVQAHSVRLMNERGQSRR